ncbi:NUDIX domain-containing protein [Patescibacteria group bacterium]|nr:NUDIX domain-containing protein [Patescibacteria group bacterium]
MKKYYIAHKAILRNENNEILILISSNPDKYGRAWDFPGGRMEDTESSFEALTREVKEEIGIKIHSATPFFSMMTSGFGSGKNDNVFKIFYISKYSGDEIELSWEHSDYLWMKVEDALKKLEGYTLDVVKAYSDYQKNYEN